MATLEIEAVHRYPGAEWAWLARIDGEGAGMLTVNKTLAKVSLGRTLWLTHGTIQYVYASIEDRGVAGQLLKTARTELGALDLVLYASGVATPGGRKTVERLKIEPSPAVLLEWAQIEDEIRVYDETPFHERIGERPTPPQKDLDPDKATKDGERYMQWIVKHAGAGVILTWQSKEDDDGPSWVPTPDATAVSLSDERG